jgi:hypothetical protein
MFSSKMRKLCPYLAKGATRSEAASSAYTLPEALKSCPYVKDLYSGFESTETETDQVNYVPKSNMRSTFDSQTTKPKLFEMEEQISTCPCRDRYGVGEVDHKAGCGKESLTCANTSKNAEVQPSATELYDSKFDTAIATLKDEGRYRKFINVERHSGSFPIATRREIDGK